jgi:hypothetical protein
MQDMIGETAPGAAPVSTTQPEPSAVAEPAGAASGGATRPREIGGREGPDPARYGDWEKNGRCIDF